MTARTTLNELIDVLRGLTGAGTADYTVGTASFWDGDQMQRVLDRYRLDVYREELQAIPFYASGSVQYFEYASQWGNFEQTSGGTAVFYVEDGTGANVGTASWSADYLRGRVTFGADTTGSTYYLTGRSFDLNASAADVWQGKAVNAAATGFDWSSDNMRVNKSQVQANYLQMADFYRSQARPRAIAVERGDAGDDALTE